MKTMVTGILFLAGVVGSFCGWIFLNMHNVYLKENIRRAERFYKEGEALFQKKNYKEAKWNYERVSEFYSKPNTKWLELAQEKEWICRAHLNDWAPSKGSSDGDVRLLQSDLYAKYKAALDRITPVPQIETLKEIIQT